MISISIKLILVIIALSIVVMTFFKNFRNNEKNIIELIKECDSICLEIKKLNFNDEDGTYNKKAVEKLRRLNREKAILVDKLLDHGYSYEYDKNNKQ